MMISKQTQHMIISIGFGLFLLAGILLHLFSPDVPFSTTEKRPLETFTPPHADALISGRFMKSFERYANDQFPFRPFFVGLKSESEKAIGKFDNGRVWFGKDKFLFEKKTTSPDLSYQVRSLASFADRLEITSPSTRRFLLIAPTATTLASDYLPPSAPAIDQVAMLADLYDSCGAYTVIDTLRALQNHQAADVFYRNDHHWTSLGAKTAYDVFATKAGFNTSSPLQESILTDSFLGTTYAKAAVFFPKADTISIFKPQAQPDPNDRVLIKNAAGHLLQTGLYDFSKIDESNPYLVFVGQNADYLKIETEANTDRSLVLIKDSYANSMLPFLTKDYATIHVIDLRYYAADIFDLIEADDKIDDILICYNFVTFSEDTNLYRLTR